MKNFPDRFPIRYVIFIEDYQGKKTGDYLHEPFAKVLWSKLVTLLQHKPIELSMLSMRYRSIGCAYDEIELCRIPELNPSQDWSDRAFDELQKLIPDGTFSKGWGSAFELGLYSYAGMGEVPLFWQVYQHRDDADYVGKKLGLYFLNFHSFKNLAERAFKMYQDIMAGNTANVEKGKLTDISSARTLGVPYSELWACLDMGQSNGLVQVKQEVIDVDEKAITHKWYEQQPKKIQVLLVKDLGSLFMEEMMALYKLADFCNNCGKMLPFDYKGKYCPDMSENQACMRERSKHRAKARRHKNVA